METPSLEELKKALNAPGLPIFPLDAIAFLKAFWKDAFLDGLNIHAWKERAIASERRIDENLKLHNQGVEEIVRRMTESEKEITTLRPAAESAAALLARMLPCLHVQWRAEIRPVLAALRHHQK